MNDKPHDYDADILQWSEHQAALLRRRAANEIDWDNIAEEIEDLGNEQRNAVESLLANIIQHRLQIMAWPQAMPVPHWQHEIDVWRVQIARRLRRAPKLRQVLADGLGELYADAVAAMYREVDGQPRPPMPTECPWTLDELLSNPS